MAPRVHTTASDRALRRPQQATALRAVLTGPWRAHDVTPAMPSVRELGVGSAESTGHRGHLASWRALKLTGHGRPPPRQEEDV